MASVPLSDDALAGADCVVIVTDHRAFDYPRIAQRARLVVDTRNAIKAPHDHVFKLGAPPVR
jgi:UDP-N-acetyl-D-glucosamine dehydrogenase